MSVVFHFSFASFFKISIFFQFYFHVTQTNTVRTMIIRTDIPRTESFFRTPRGRSFEKKIFLVSIQILPSIDSEIGATLNRKNLLLLLKIRIFVYLL